MFNYRFLQKFEELYYLQQCLVILNDLPVTLAMQNLSFKHGDYGYVLGAKKYFFLLSMLKKKREKKSYVVQTEQYQCI